MWIQVTNSGSDRGSLTPMAEQIQERTGQLPETVMADGGHAKHDDIAKMEAMGIKVILPPADNAKPLEEMADADPGVLAWRQRMETPEAQELYRARAGLSELPNAHQKSHHGLSQFLVRGLEKVTCVVFLSALSSNILQHAIKFLS